MTERPSVTTSIIRRRSGDDALRRWAPAKMRASAVYVDPIVNSMDEMQESSQERSKDNGHATSLKESNTTMPRRLPLVLSKYVPYTRSRMYCTRRGQFRPTDAERSMTRRTSTMHSVQSTPASWLWLHVLLKYPEWGQLLRSASAPVQCTLLRITGRVPGP